MFAGCHHPNCRPNKVSKRFNTTLHTSWEGGLHAFTFLFFTAQGIPRCEWRGPNGCRFRAQTNACGRMVSTDYMVLSPWGRAIANGSNNVPRLDQVFIESD
eukprot:4295765-Amphidinium_carterae.2